MVPFSWFPLNPEVSRISSFLSIAGRRELTIVGKHWQIRPFLWSVYMQFFFSWWSLFPESYWTLMSLGSRHFAALLDGGSWPLWESTGRSDHFDVVFTCSPFFLNPTEPQCLQDLIISEYWRKSKHSSTRCFSEAILEHLKKATVCPDTPMVLSTVRTGPKMAAFYFSLLHI